MTRRRVRLTPEQRRAARCMDCDSQVSPVATVVDGFTLLRTAHDRTCPTFRKLGNGREFLEIILFDERF